MIKGELKDRVGRWLRFLLGGSINTALSYAIYITFNTILAYQIAYFISYAMGVVFAYWFNASVVFKIPLSWKGLFSYPVVYMVQYLVSAFLLGSLVEFFRMAETLAPLTVTLVILPLTYMMNKMILGLDKKKLIASTKL
jgi:putative flippase GtrA